MKQKFIVSAVKTVELVTEFIVTAEDETEAEKLAELRIGEDDRNIQGSSLQWDPDGGYHLDIPEIRPLNGPDI